MFSKYAKSWFAIAISLPLTCLMHLWQHNKCARRPTIDLIQKSQNAPVPYPRMLHSEQKCAHFCSEWSILGYGTGTFWDLWNWSIALDQTTDFLELWWNHFSLFVWIVNHSLMSMFDRVETDTSWKYFLTTYCISQDNPVMVWYNMTSSS